MRTRQAPKAEPGTSSIWQSINVQFLYRHQNQRYYVRTFAGGKEKWSSLKTTLLFVAKNRIKEHVDATKRQQSSGETAVAVGAMTFGHALARYRDQLKTADVRPTRRCTEKPA